jgi:ADP-ribose pyrophosphatase
MARTATRTARTRDVIYTGRVFTIERDRIVMPDGRRATMEIVRHRGSVVLVPQPAPNRVILIRQFRYVLNRRIWELPAGTLEPGERPDRAARRECEEEIGLRPSQITRLGDYYPTPGFCDEHMTFYLCRGLTRPARPRAGDEDEDIEPKTFTIAQAWSLVRSGGIIDMKTVLGLAMLDRRVPLARSR